MTISGNVFEAEENTTVVLPCVMVLELQDQGILSVHKIRIWQRGNGDVLFYQYLYNDVVYEDKPAARADMSLDAENFTLTIGRVQLEDDTFFVCTSGLGNVESVRLRVYGMFSVLCVV